MWSRGRLWWILGWCCRRQWISYKRPCWRWRWPRWLSKEVGVLGKLPICILTRIGTLKQQGWWLSVDGEGNSTEVDSSKCFIVFLRTHAIRRWLIDWSVTETWSWDGVIKEMVWGCTWKGCGKTVLAFKRKKWKFLIQKTIAQAR
jgi:hypothetical protein